MPEPQTPRRSRRRANTSQEASWDAFLANNLATTERAAVDCFLAGLASLGTRRAA